MNKTKTWFDPDTSFFRLPIVWITVATIIAIAIFIGRQILTESSLYTGWAQNYQGINSALTLFKVPLGILSLLIPIGAIYAVNHRSEQARKQISITQEQNLFSNYYKHLEEFEKYVKNNLERSDKTEAEKNVSKSINIRHLHEIFYPKLRSDGDISLNQDVIDQAEYYMRRVLSRAVNPSHYNGNHDYEIATILALGDLDCILKEKNIDFGDFIVDQTCDKQEVLDKYQEHQIAAGADPDEISDTCSLYIAIDAFNRVMYVQYCFDIFVRFEHSNNKRELFKKLSDFHFETDIYSRHKSITLTNKMFQTLKLFQNEQTGGESGLSGIDTHPIERKTFIKFVQSNLKSLKEKLDLPDPI